MPHSHCRDFNSGHLKHQVLAKFNDWFYQYRQSDYSSDNSYNYDYNESDFLYYQDDYQRFSSTN